MHRFAYVPQLTSLLTSLYRIIFLVISHAILLFAQKQLRPCCRLAGSRSPRRHPVSRGGQGKSQAAGTLAGLLQGL